MIIIMIKIIVIIKIRVKIFKILKIMKMVIILNPNQTRFSQALWNFSLKILGLISLVHTVWDNESRLL